MEMTWVGLRIWVPSIKERKKHEGKTLKNNAKHKNE
jgi:hypothetical protein